MNEIISEIASEKEVNNRDTLHKTVLFETEEINIGTEYVCIAEQAVSIFFIYSLDFP